MNSSFGFKLLGAAGLAATLFLAACGGGGGDPGAPVVPPTLKLMMTPNIGGLTMQAGSFAEPVKISGGQKPYYVGSTSAAIIPTLLDDGTLHVQALSATDPTESGDTSSGGASIWIQDSSYSQTTLSIPVSVGSSSGGTTAPPSSSFTVIPPTQLLSEGSVGTTASGAPIAPSISFLLINGTGPFYVNLPTSVGGIPASGLISVSPMAITSASTPLQVTLVATCIASNKTVPLTVTDTATGNVATATVQIQNTDPSNDGTAGCL